MGLLPVYGKQTEQHWAAALQLCAVVWRLVVSLYGQCSAGEAPSKSEEEEVVGVRVCAAGMKAPWHWTACLSFAWTFYLSLGVPPSVPVAGALLSPFMTLSRHQDYQDCSLAVDTAALLAWIHCTGTHHAAHISLCLLPSVVCCSWAIVRGLSVCLILSACQHKSMKAN